MNFIRMHIQIHARLCLYFLLYFGAHTQPFKQSRQINNNIRKIEKLNKNSEFEIFLIFLIIIEFFWRDEKRRKLNGFRHDTLNTECSLFRV